MINNLNFNKTEEDYNLYNEEQKKERKSNNTSIIESIEKVYDSSYGLFTNFLTLKNSPVMLSHDAYIIVNRYFDPYSSNSNLYKSYNKEDYLIKSTLSFVTDLLNVTESLIYEYNVPSNIARPVTWGILKSVSVDYYTNEWKKKYGCFMEKALKEYEKQSASLKNYIFDVALYDEFSIRDGILIAHFTYYAMSKGYDKGDKNFPGLYEDVLDKFNTII